MIVVTTNDIPGSTVTRVIGDVYGLTVRSRHIGSNIGAGVKSIGGGELKGITKLMGEVRDEALDRLKEEAAAQGANAVLGFRFETNQYDNAGVEVCAYGTAVTIG